MPIANEVEILTAGDILDIAVDNGPDPVESELEADMYESDVNKVNVGKFKIQFDDVLDESDELKEISLELSDDFIISRAISGDECAILVTQYGDMRSFVSSADQESNESYGST